jgi:antitoxin Phd
MSSARETSSLQRTKNQAKPVPESGTPRSAGSVTVSATEAQNEFGRILDQATHDQAVIITRHNVPRAVLVSASRYRELISAESTILNTLTDEFDAMLNRMQTPEVRSATSQGFQATSKSMGRTAQLAARRARNRANDRQ